MPLTTPTILLGFLLPWMWGISSGLLQQSAVAAPYLGQGVSPHHHPSWPWTWRISSRPSWASFPESLIQEIWDSSGVNNVPANAGDAGDIGSITGSRRSPGGSNDDLLQYPGKNTGQRSLMGYSPWGGKESHMTEHTCMSICTYDKCPGSTAVTALRITVRTTALKAWFRSQRTLILWEYTLENKDLV